ncbi:MAG: UDP-N-acetylmuramate--L-alanine ligase [Bacteroidales bacterium]|nr:UDP-N-acetylmuramate--L-alanine ligase [Bacteroidales bacterium]
MNKTEKTYYFIGIGGIGMSALALYFHKTGYKVAGYDKTESKITKQLDDSGINVNFNENISAIPELFKNSNNTIVIYTPAIPSNHEQLQYFINNKFKVFKRSEVLSEIANQMRSIAIAGTHGKTSITSLTAWLLNQNELETNAFMGGISNNFNSNLVIQPNANTVVLEADEYDRSFLRLNPDIALISFIDADHLDIYGSAKSMQNAYSEFLAKIKPNGIAVIKLDTASQLTIPKNINLYTYSRNNVSADFYADNINISKNKTHFDLVFKGERIENLSMSFAGNHHIENAVAASALALLAGANKNHIKQGLKDFKGVKRRFEYIVNQPDIVYIDDYAHHPNEIEASLNALRSLYPNKKITGIFQPHLYTRTRDFSNEFVQALSKFDEIILLDIYPARELPIEGVNSEMLLQKITNKNKKLCTKENLIDYIQNYVNTDVLISMGAGDIDRLVEPIKNILEK